MLLNSRYYAVPVVLHRITENYCTSHEDVLEDNLRYIAKCARESAVSISSYIKLKNIDQIRYLLTFDDGNLSDYTIALPVLHEYRAKATFFIISDMIGKKNYLTWDMVKEINIAGMEIGSHSHTHQNLTKIKIKDATYEIEKSKDIIEDKIGCSIQGFSFPYGYYNSHLIDKVYAANYSYCCTSKHGVVKGFREIPRNSINRNMTKYQIMKTLKPNSLTRLGWCFNDAAKSIVKKAINEKLYVTLRNKLLPGSVND